MDAMVAKPIQLTELLAVMQRAIDSAEARKAA